jgi:hypothetical protein
MSKRSRGNLQLGVQHTNVRRAGCRNGSNLMGTKESRGSQRMKRGREETGVTSKKA